MTKVNNEIQLYLSVKDKIDLYKVCNIIDFEPHTGQREYFDIINEGKFSVLVANMGRRFGKTVSISKAALADLLAPNASVLIVAPTHTNAKVIFNEIFKDTSTAGLKVSAKDIKGLTISFANNSRVQVITSKNYDSARGYHFSLVIFEEYTYIDNIKMIMEDVIGPAQADYGFRDGYSNSKTILIGTATSKGTEAYEIFRKGEEGPYKVKGYVSLTLPTSVNPFISNDYIEAMREKLDPVSFKKEYLCEWTDADENLVYYAFSRDKNVIPHEKAIATINENTRFLVGIDVGFTDNTGFLLGYVEPFTGNIIIIEEYKQGEVPLSVHARMFKEKEAIYNVKKVTRVGDPSAAQVISDLALDYNYTVAPAQNSIDFGIQSVNNKFHHGKLLISDNCTGLIQEIENMYWKNEAAKTVKRDKKFKHFDLSLSTLRYLVYTYDIMNNQSILLV
jgi:hypothetical protein